jgi:hypothetical protein
MLVTTICPQYLRDGADGLKKDGRSDTTEAIRLKIKPASMLFSLWIIFKRRLRNTKSSGKI